MRRESYDRVPSVKNTARRNQTRRTAGGLATDISTRVADLLRSSITHAAMCDREWNKEAVALVGDVAAMLHL